MQIVGDGLLDEVRHAVHDEVAHTGDYLKHCHKLIPLTDKSQKTPPKRQTIIDLMSRGGYLHVTAYLAS